MLSSCSSRELSVTSVHTVHSEEAEGPVQCALHDQHHASSYSRHLTGRKDSPASGMDTLETRPLDLG